MAGRSPDIGSGDLLNQAAARRRSAGRGEWAAGMRGRWAEGSRQARLACRAEAWRRLEGLCLNPKTTGKESTHASTLRGGARKNHAPDPESVARFAETLRLRSLAAALPSIRQIVADTGLRRNGIPGGPAESMRCPHLHTPLRCPSGAVVTRSPQPPRPIQSA